MKHYLWLILLVGTGALVEARSKLFKSSPQEQLVEAIQNGDTNKVKALLDPKNKINLNEPSAITYLMWAAMGQLGNPPKTEIVEALLDAGAHVNKPSKKTLQTPLSVAATGDIVRLLVQRGAQLEARDKDGQTPLLAQIITTGVTHDVDVIEALLDAHAEVNAQNNNGETALHLVLNGAVVDPQRTIQLVKWFLDHGANPLIPNKKGITALSKAEMKRLKEITLMLLAAGSGKK